MLSGESVSSSGAGATARYYLDMWTESSMNQATRPVLIRVPSKDTSGDARNLDIVLYKVQFEPISFDGPTYKDGLKINYAGYCLMSDVDETGATLAQKMIGRIVSLPTGIV